MGNINLYSFWNDRVLGNMALSVLKIWFMRSLLLALILRKPTTSFGHSSWRLHWEAWRKRETTMSKEEMQVTVKISSTNSLGEWIRIIWFWCCYLELLDCLHAILLRVGGTFLFQTNKVVTSLRNFWILSSRFLLSDVFSCYKYHIIIQVLPYFCGPILCGIYRHVYSLCPKIIVHFFIFIYLKINVQFEKQISIFLFYPLITLWSKFLFLLLSVKVLFS